MFFQVLCPSPFLFKFFFIRNRKKTGYNNNNRNNKQHHNAMTNLLIEINPTNHKYYQMQQQRNQNGLSYMLFSFHLISLKLVFFGCYSSFSSSSSFLHFS